MKLNAENNYKDLLLEAEESLKEQGYRDHPFYQVKASITPKNDHESVLDHLDSQNAVYALDMETNGDNLEDERNNHELSEDELEVLLEFEEELRSKNVL